LLVADPPSPKANATTRWPGDGLAILGLQLEGIEIVMTPAGATTVAALLATSQCPEHYPRRSGLPTKRPLF
ncbi:MAG TPA: hypothetical protein VED59_04500, partial [Acidimicrobiales bacterium]|nr:hypothetical protein [Acidimicrobiales bacterium]